MKGKLKYIIFIIIILGVVFSILYTKKKNKTFDVKTDVNISFTNPATEVSTEASSVQESSSSSETKSTAESSSISKEVSETSSEANKDLIILTDDNFKDTIIKLATLDSSNASNLDKLPITDAFKNELKKKGSMIDGVDSTSSINFQMGGISENNTYMAQFRVGNIVYIVTGNISNNQIWSFDYRKM